MNLTVVVVSYNREVELLRSLRQYKKLISYISCIVVVDNASSDGTSSMLAHQAHEFGKKLDFLTLGENLGGSGGFSKGVELAIKKGADWIWLCDDDAVPDDKCFIELEKYCNDRGSVYGCYAQVNDAEHRELCWPLPLVGGGVLRKEVSGHLAEVKFLPFLGFCIHSTLIKKIGLPAKDYFISGDDFEYCSRVRSQGGRLFLVRDSLVRHPSIPKITVGLFGYEMRVLKMPAWRYFYDFRNRLWTARRYGNAVEVLKVLLSLSSRLFLLMLTSVEGGRGKTFFSAMKGVKAGLLSSISIPGPKYK